MGLRFNTSSVVAASESVAVVDIGLFQTNTQTLVRVPYFGVFSLFQYSPFVFFRSKCVFFFILLHTACLGTAINKMFVGTDENNMLFH